MWRYVVKRVLHAFFVMLAVSVLVFLLARLTGNPAALFLGDNSTHQDLLRIEHVLGLDKPLWVQYWIFLRNALHGNLGESIWFQQPAFQLVVQRLPATAELAFTAFLLALAFSVPAGTYAALHRGKAGDWGIVGLTALGQSIPVFVLGILLTMLLSVRLRLLPAAGIGGISHLVMPAVSLAVFSAAKIARLTRTSVLENIHKDHVRTAYSKGLTRGNVLRRHVLRNAASPIVTISGLELGQLLSGVVITETIFGWPGVGQLAVEAINHSDYPLIQADALVVAVIIVVLNLLVDLSYAALNPRIRLDGKEQG